ncbi:M48 family metallopeptidase [Robertkochia solimangrovi]|uniref:M48 family metallopeptidase n=1 Tax=Robertkochia solimangrovi TaxID=2213046 RepID=UPI00117E47E6|nr:SprT family zinc-dependent metalloprotease [Robertkochia solimangrovi]TRZ41672.1 M48 family peptidase [Robertkochia solimangrovi]
MEDVAYGTQTIYFHLRRVERKTLAIEVHPDLSIWAIAPLKASLSDVKKRIVRRGTWINKQLNYFEQFLPRTPEREYVSGETHLYLGRRYLLRVRHGEENSVKLKGGELFVYCKTKPKQELVRRLLAEWYYNHAKKRFDKVISEQIQRYKRFDIEAPEVEIRRMKNRWGSCTPKGKIILNPELIKAPGKCIEYVLIHELCHLVHPNHGKQFYALLGELLPGWVKWKEKLEQTIF